jgi:isoleucyl-tRNA synthetase
LNDSDAISENDWHTIFTVREAVSKQLEHLRSQGKIGSSLNAEVTIYCQGDVFNSLEKLATELRFALITSETNLKYIKQNSELQASDSVVLAEGFDDVWISAYVSEHQKCTRCWHHRADVGQYIQHPELCGRCISNIDAEGEVRHYA